MRLELVSIETDTEPLAGLYYEPDGGATAGAALVMHGNCKNFYTGPSRFLPPRLVQSGFACLAHNRRGHDVVVTPRGREPGGGAFQLIDQAIDDNRRAADWLARRGFPAPVVIGHSNGGMLAIHHCSERPDTPALVLLSAHMGGHDFVERVSRGGLLARDRVQEITARARELAAAGRGRELIMLPDWYWAISAESFLDILTNVPDGLSLAPKIGCPALYMRGDKEPKDAYPAEEFAARAGSRCDVRILANCDHFYTGEEDQVCNVVTSWLDETLGISGRGAAAAE
jgi:pimeloyl-ACP methyl ester carboxylesterase